MQMRSVLFVVFVLGVWDDGVLAQDVNPYQYVSDRIAQYDIAQLPEGKYTITCVEPGPFFGKTIDYQAPKDQVKKRFFQLVKKGLYYSFTAIFLALGFGWLGALSWIAGAVLIAGSGAAAGLLIIPLAAFAIKHRIILSNTEAEVWTLSYQGVTTPGAFTMGLGVNANAKMKSDVLHAKLTKNYNHRGGTPSANVPRELIARLDPNPTAVAAMDEYIVYLQFYQPNGLSQWLAAALPKGDIVTSPLIMTAWKFTKVGI